MAEIAPGTKLGVHELVARIGSGGMGDVWRARDTKLGRDVAIKILPEDLSDDGDRLARFEREARTLAALNHPGIATLFELAEHDGLHYLVMELVEGETLAVKIARGPLAPKLATNLFHQIADALEDAHEKGVVHRDLKPANIVVTPDGKTKVLDFGLAKALAPPGRAPEPKLSESPTVTKNTALGVILGTAPYMSPEQARAQPVDRRTDVWAFGCCLFESLTGQPTFTGSTLPDTLASILAHEPPWGRLPPDTPRTIRKVMERCLQKDARQRWQHMGDVRIELESSDEALAGAGDERRSPRRAVAASFAAVVIGAAGTWLLLPDEQPAPPIRLQMTTEELNASFHPTLSMSPDGSILAYNPRRFPPMLRHLDGSFHAVVPGVEGGGMPTFSPDGEWIVYFEHPELKKVSIAGGTPVTLCEADGPGPRAASWGDDGTIVFNYGYGALKRVSENGGDVVDLTQLEEGEVSHYFPDVLPGSEAVLFTAIGPRSGMKGEIGLYDFGTGETRYLGTGTTARYAESGHIVFFRDGSLHATTFDLATLEVKGSPVPVVEDVYVYPATAIAHFDISPTGTLVYVPWAPEDVRRKLVWIDRSGNVRREREFRRDIGYPRFSPDGRDYLVTIIDRLERQIWIANVDRDTLTPVGQGSHAEWAPDGTVASFIAGVPTFSNLASPDVTTTLADRPLFPASWSPDGTTLAAVEMHPETGPDIWTVERDGSREPTPIHVRDGWQSSPEFSPDGRYLAHVGGESGSMHVFVQPFPGPGRAVQVSIDSGITPLWHPDGTELFYRLRGGGGLVSVDVTTEPTFRVLSEPTPVLPNDYEWQFGPSAFRNFDISPDGETFLVIESIEEFEPTTVAVVLNWFQELERLAPHD